MVGPSLRTSRSGQCDASHRIVGSVRDSAREGQPAEMHPAACRLPELLRRSEYRPSRDILSSRSVARCEARPASKWPAEGLLHYSVRRSHRPERTCGVLISSADTGPARRHSFALSTRSKLDGEDLRRELIETCKSTRKSLLRGKHAGIAFNAHFIADSAIVCRRACALGCEGIVSKASWGPRTAPSALIAPAASAVTREAGEEVYSPSCCAYINL
jgi:hypothetical protein